MSTHLLKAGNILNIVTDATTTGSYQNLASGAPVALTASTTIVVGPSTIDARYEIYGINGVPAVTQAPFVGNLTASSTELNYVDGVTSALQTQMGLKAPLASPALTGSPTVAKANGTESANAVTANGAAGRITTSALTTGAGATYAITWTNSSIVAGSAILVTLAGGTNTRRVSFEVVAGSGSATLNIHNVNLISALDGTVLINYLVA